MNVTYDFSGRTSIVTGAGRGVGRQIVADFVATGAQVLGS